MWLAVLFHIHIILGSDLSRHLTLYDAFSDSVSCTDLHIITLLLPRHVSFVAWIPLRWKQKTWYTGWRSGSSCLRSWTEAHFHCCFTAQFCLDTINPPIGCWFIKLRYPLQICFQIPGNPWRKTGLQEVNDWKAANLSSATKHVHNCVVVLWNWQFKYKWC